MKPFSFHHAVKRLQDVCRDGCRFLGLMEVLAPKARLIHRAALAECVTFPVSSLAADQTRQFKARSAREGLLKRERAW
jgi:hypothetical protein